MKSILKKILSSITAFCLSATMLFNISVSAAFAPAAPLAIPLIGQVLLGIGAVLVTAGIISQADLDGLSNNDLQNKINEVLSDPGNSEKLEEAISNRSSNAELDNALSSLGTSLNDIKSVSDPDLLDSFKMLTLSLDVWLSEQSNSGSGVITGESKLVTCFYDRWGDLDYYDEYVGSGGIFRDPQYNADGSLSSFIFFLNTVQYNTYSAGGELRNSQDYNTTLSGSCSLPSGLTTYQFVGAWTWEGVDVPPEGVDVVNPPGAQDPTIDEAMANASPGSIVDLIEQMMSAVGTISLPAEDTDVDDLISSTTIDLPDELSDLELKPSIASVFPFCIPFDFVRGIKLLAVTPQAPRFEVPFNLPEFGSFPGFEKDIVIDFEEYSKYFDVVRWGFYVIFLFGLCFVTFKLVKGA